MSFSVTSTACADLTKARTVLRRGRRRAPDRSPMIESGETYLGVATDHVIESFRNRLWADYKTGTGIEPALRAQFHPLEEALAAMGVVVWPMIQLEADDALASAAHLAAKDRRSSESRSGRPIKTWRNACEAARGADRRPAKNHSRCGWDTRKIWRPSAAHSDLLALVGDAAELPASLGSAPRPPPSFWTVTVRSKISRRMSSGNSASLRCSSRNSRRFAPMRRSLRRSRRCAGEVRRRHSRPGRRGWKRRGCSSVAKRLRPGSKKIQFGNQEARKRE